MSSALLVVACAAAPALVVGAGSVAASVLIPWMRQVDHRLRAVEQRGRINADPSPRRLAVAARDALDADRTTGQREAFAWCANYLDQVRGALVGPDVDVELSLARIAMTFREWANDPARMP